MTLVGLVSSLSLSLCLRKIISHNLNNYRFIVNNNKMKRREKKEKETQRSVADHKDTTIGYY